MEENRFTLNVREHVATPPTLSFAFTPGKGKSPFRMVPCSIDMLNVLGRITLGWACFESEFDDLIRRLIVANPGHKAENGEWEFQGFKKRKTLYLNLIYSTFRQHRDVIKYAEDTIHIAGSAFEKRNLFVHGQISAVLNASGVEIRCTGRYKGLPVSMAFNQEELEEIYLDIGHANGRLGKFTDPNCEFPDLSSQGRSLLRDFLLTSPRTLAT